MEPTYDVKTSDQLNLFLTGVLKDVRKGIIKGDDAAVLSQIADKINKNNVNALMHQKQIKSIEPLPFFK